MYAECNMVLHMFYYYVSIICKVYPVTVLYINIGRQISITYAYITITYKTDTLHITDISLLCLNLVVVGTDIKFCLLLC